MTSSSPTSGRCTTWVVFHIIHVRTPYQYIPKLFITDVPEVGVTWEDIDEYGEFGEFGIPHANHALEQLSPISPPQLKRDWRDPGSITPRVSYAELTRLKTTV